jgi:hypothetical protein
MNNMKTNFLESGVISPNIWTWITICLIVNSLTPTIGATAQSLPPPVPNMRVDDSEVQTEGRQFQFPKSFQPPVIEVMTEELRDGKNVFRMNITSEAPIKYCNITFTKGDIERTEDCVRDIGTVFKVLIDAKQPYQIVHIHARDIYGDSSSIVEKLRVLPQLTINEAIWNSLSSLLGNVYSAEYFVFLS